MLYLEEEKTSPAIIKVIGVGGGGMNAVTRMVSSQLKGVEFIVMNTDEQVLLKSPVENRLQLGSKVTRGMGAGGDPELGEKAAKEDKDRVMAILKGADMVFITAGMGGGTGTGAAPVIAGIAKEMKCLVVGVVTLPFSFEGKRRMENAIQGIDELRNHVDTLITIKNDSIFQVVDRTTPVDQAFRVIDDILLNGVRGISDIINNPGIINVDFADVKSIMKDTGDAVLGVGEGTGESKIVNAVEYAIHNALLEDTSISGAKSLLVNVTGGSDLTIHDWNEVSQIITSQVDPEANIIIGLNEDPDLSETIRVTVIATGFHKSNSIKKPIEEPIKKAVGMNEPHSFSNKMMTNVSSTFAHNSQSSESMESQTVRNQSTTNLQNSNIGNSPFSNSNSGSSQSRNLKSGSTARQNNWEEDLEIPAFIRRNRE